MNCLCCGKPIVNASETEQANQWHKSCIKSFFGISQFPEIELSDDMLEALAVKSTSEGYTVTGVQKKLSLNLSRDNDNAKPRLTFVNYPVGYILKPQTDEYRNLPEAEYSVMRMAGAVGIKTVPFALVKIKEKREFAYITKRIDRGKSKDGKTIMLAMEDFCQLDKRLTADKYKGSYERCGKIVSEYSYRKRLDMTELFLRIVFSFAVGNSDMHLKNFSLIETKEGSAEYFLSAAYDLLPVNVLLPEDEDELALTVNGKKRNLRRNDFMALAENFGIDNKTASRLIDAVTKKEKILIRYCRESFLPGEIKEPLENLIVRRTERLSNQQ